MKKITFYENNGQRYAKISGSSYRVGDKVQKRDDGLYLGKVVNEEDLVFYSKERGLFTFDPETGAFGEADESYLSEMPKDRRKRLNICLDFGDSYFVHALIRSMKYDSVIDDFQYRNKDTLNAMIQYYILRNAANVHAGIWYEGSIASHLYPTANLSSQRISDFLKSIGRRDHVEEFFDAHIGWIKKHISTDPAVMIDSTGLPNSIHFPLTAISNHNGKISREVRMSVMLQRDSGYPLMFRLTPGNVNDVSTITRSIQELSMHGIPTDFALMDAGYFSADNVDALYGAEVDFLTRLPERNKNLYKYILDQGLGTLKEERNLVNYNGRAVYIKQVECRIGKGLHRAYAYLGYDANRASDEIHKAAEKLSLGKMSQSKFQNVMDHAGLFIIISSLPFAPDEILEVYYIRQMIEQYFDLSKGSSELTPLRIHSEDALYGHLILSTIASTINTHIMKTMKQHHDDKEALFMSLANQKCLVHNTQINPCEPTAKANAFYDKFKIECPLYLERTKKGLKPKNQLRKMAELQV